MIQKPFFNLFIPLLRGNSKNYFKIGFVVTIYIFVFINSQQINFNLFLYFGMFVIPFSFLLVSFAIENKYLTKIVIKTSVRNRKTDFSVD